MCARFSLTAPLPEIEAFLGAELDAELPPRANVAPTLDVPALVLNGGARELRLFRWGLVPYWAKDQSTKFINARSETVLEKAAFRDSFKKRRCVIPADGFYEWRDEPIEESLFDDKPAKTAKRPYLFSRNHGLMGMAGLWDRWRSPDGAVSETFTILTTEPNVTLEPFHDRMPCILDPADFDSWISPEDSPERLMALLRPFPDDEMKLQSADPKLNNVRYEPCAL
jgi:putative SOS response-associated peptidase YedK